MTMTIDRANPPDGLPLNAVWMSLRERWIAASNGRTSASLTAHLRERLGRAYTQQSVSQWATGSDGRRPPWIAVCLLLDELGLELVVRGDGSVGIAGRSDV